MTEPKTYTLDVPGATLSYDVRASETSTEPVLLIIGSPMGADGFVTLAGQFPDRTLVAHEPPASQELPDREAIVAACTDIRETYERSGFGPATATFIVLAG